MFKNTQIREGRAENHDETFFSFFFFSHQLSSSQLFHIQEQFNLEHNFPGHVSKLCKKNVFAFKFLTSNGIYIYLPWRSILNNSKLVWQIKVL